MEKNNIAFYISDHGFGHISRCIPLIAETAKRMSELRYHMIYVVCNEAHCKFAKANLEQMLDVNHLGLIIFRVEHTDIGLLVKENSLEPDREQIESQCKDFLAQFPTRVQKEEAWIAEHGISLAFVDMPIWAIQACKNMRVPFLYAGNFTWVELYRELIDASIWLKYEEVFSRVEHAIIYDLHNQEMLSVLEHADKTYTSLLCRPFCDQEVEKIKRSVKYANAPIIFCAIGMSAAYMKEVDVSKVRANFFVTEGFTMKGDNVQIVAKDTIQTQNYVAAADYVITKAGWGTVSECLLAKKPMMLFERDCVLEDRNTIEILCAKGSAIKSPITKVQNMENVIQKLQNAKFGGFTGYYNGTSEIVDKLFSL